MNDRETNDTGTNDDEMSEGDPSGGGTGGGEMNGRGAGAGDTDGGAPDGRESAGETGGRGAGALETGQGHGGPGRAGGTRRQLRATDVKRLNRAWRRGTESRVAMIVESVTGPFNVGSIFRTAAAFGVEYIWLAGNTTPPVNPKAQKTALGTDRFVPWEEGVTPGEAVRAARSEGFKVVAVELTGDALPLHEADLEGDVCLAVGSEDHGCSPALLEAADGVCYIPQTGRVGSLNVAIAAAIALAETRRREWAGRSPAPEAPD